MTEKQDEEKREKRSVKAFFVMLKNAILRLFLRLISKKTIPFVCVILAFGLFLLGGAWTVSAAVCHKTGERIVTEAELAALDVEFDCILVLGCLVRQDGTLSDRLADRVNTGIALYQNGFCDRILMSGDSEYADYDEVGAMARTAIDSGVPTECVSVDPHGLSTYESLIRLRDVFGMKRVLIVTQEYHLYRAIYVAEKLGMDAYGVSATHREYQKQIQMEMREVFARCKDVVFGLIQPEPTYTE